MKALITGASGFVGQHLVAYLAQQTDLELIGTTITPPPPNTSVQWWEVDLRDAERVHAMLDQVRPALIFHLAAQAFVPDSLEKPWFTLENNLHGQVNIFDSLVKLALDCRVLVVSSAHVYGKIRPEDNPIREDQPFRPDTPYAVSKVGQDMLALQYYLAYGLPTVRARPFNHIGPGQNTRFALPNFAEQIAAIEAGEQPPILRVGNLDAERDFTDVRDVVRAYYLLLMHGSAGEAYNVCRGEPHSLKGLLDMMRDLSSVELTIEVDESRLRPLDVPCIFGDAGKLRQDTGWQPTIDIRQSLADILDHSRKIRTSS